MMILLAAAIAVPVAIIAFIVFASCIIGGRYDDDTDQLYDDCPWPLIDGPLVPRGNSVHQIHPKNCLLYTSAIALALIQSAVVGETIFAGGTSAIE